MAAFSHSRAGSRAYHGGGSAQTGQELPSGSCNFRDLRPGASIVRCGCRRYWDSAEKAWCFCGHHACFHDAFSQQRQQESGLGLSVPQGDTNFEQVEDDRNAPPPGYVPAQQAAQSPPKRLAGLGIQAESRSQSQSINTRIWEALNGFARQQEDGGFSDMPSTAAPSMVDEPRVSPEYTQQLPSQAHHSMGPPVNIPQNAVVRMNQEELSATEVNTPSLAGTPDFRAIASSSSQMRPSPGHLPPGRFITGPSEKGNGRPAAPVSRGVVEASIERPNIAAAVEPSLLEMQNLVRSYGQRLDLLESISFSHVPVEELQERFEHFDGRLLDLEHWRTDRDREQEQQEASAELAGPSRNKRRRLLPDTESFTSDASFDSNAAAHTEAVVMATLATNAITDPRLEALESRVTDLESAAPPSFARPWQVEVVLLPWGRQLRGIWFSATESTQRSLRSATQEEWSGAQSMPKLSLKSSDSAAWTTESIQAWANEAQDWLSPKACGPTGTVFQRLASRGLVQDVTFKALDSRHLLSVLRTAFGHILGKADGATSAAKIHQGLAEDFIPLRKVRKSSRLRFLTPAEMVTAAGWDAAFLDSSVFMKVGEGHRRLYLTMSDAYSQTEDGWSWADLRLLPIFEAGAEEQAAQATGSAIEACWSYNENLDFAASAHSSFASRMSPWAAATPNVQDDDEDDILAMSVSAAGHPRIHRTVSLPNSSMAASIKHADLPKRRVASFETAGMVPIHADEHGLEVQAKRRRISISPEAERRGVNFTPRWSREPPSPFTSEGAMEARSQGASSRNKRGATPFAYATPHSNSQYIGRPAYLGGDGDTEVNTDWAADQSDRAEEEWEGMDDGPVGDAAAEDQGELSDGVEEVDGEFEV